jgi:hypothetical protein
MIKKEFDLEKFKRDWKAPNISKKGLEFLYGMTYSGLRKIALKKELGSRNRKSGREKGWNLKNE